MTDYRTGWYGAHCLYYQLGTLGFGLGQGYLHNDCTNSIPWSSGVALDFAYIKSSPKGTPRVHILRVEGDGDWHDVE